ncbi:TrkA family potassium uptake protein [bacterium]|nr:TrkA family potassium uptake protein [bacterium]
MKTYIIIGLSTFGRYLAQFLSEKSFHVIAIDSDENRVNQVKEFVSKGIVSDAKDIETLQKIGVDKADGVIVSLGDKVDDSMVLVYHLKKMGVKTLYVKVLNDVHAKIINMIGYAEIIFPEYDSAFKLAQRIDNPNILDFIPLSPGYSVMNWSPTRPFVGKSIGESDLKKKYNVMVISIEEMVPHRTNLIPDAGHVIKDSDVLVLIGKNEDLKRLIDEKKRPE